jgi:Sulfotransferase domain
VSGEPASTGPAGTGPAGIGPAGTVRIAMWSGPRTVSTALMRAWENRADTAVVDEPLYAFYLDRTGMEHPGRADVIASMPADWRVVLAGLAAGPVPGGARIYYQKHMTHHLLPEIDRDALRGLRHAFLIRDPRQLLASYARVRSEPTLADLGLEQQAGIFRAFGGPVLDAGDLLRSPRAALEALCAALGVPFDPAMLSWPAGPRPTDGVWAPYWYDGVRASTGFGPYREPAATGLPPRLESLAARCRPFYEEMAAARLTA